MSMDDLRAAFEGEPPETVHTHENVPPPRPEKIPVQTNAGTVPLEKMKKQYGRSRSDHERRHTRESLAGGDGGDVAIEGGEKSHRSRRERSAEGSPPRPSFTQNLVLDPTTLDAQQAHYQDSNLRPGKSQDDIDVLRRTSHRDDEEVHLLREQVGHLRERLVAANKRVYQVQHAAEKQVTEAENRAEQAERVVEELELQIKSSLEEVATGTDTLADAFEELKSENKGLKAELDEARSHIFSLQPYRKDLTPEEVGRDFDDLVSSVTDWVTKLVEPIIDDPDRVEDVLAGAKKRPNDAQKLRRYMDHYADLLNGSMFPDTDIDILIAVAMRYLYDNVFQHILIGHLRGVGEVLGFVEASMQTNVEPRRDLFALRTWRSEAMNAVICSPDYQRARGTRAKDLTIELVGLFKLFFKGGSWNNVCVTCHDEVISPAIELHEKLLTATHHFYLDINPYIVHNSRQEWDMSPDFLDNLHKLKCENILQNRKPFNIARMEPKPTRDQLHTELTNVVTIVPALNMRQVGKGDAIKEPTVVRKQHMLVAWGTEEKRDKFAANNSERTMLNRLCFPPREKQDKSSDGGTWGGWKGMTNFL